MSSLPARSPSGAGKASQTTQAAGAVAQLQARWALLASRERRLVVAAVALVAVALLWWIALAPALATLHAAPAQHAALDAQLQQMQSLQRQALALQTQPKLPGDEARRTLEAGLKQTLAATAQMSVAGDRATVTLKGASPDALAQWLAQARVNARAVPSEVKLVKNGALWDGTVVLSLPPR